MFVTSTTALETFDGNGSTSTPYPISIQRDRNEDLFLLLDGEPSSDFSIAADGLRTGTAVPPGVTLTVFRFTPRTQETPFPPNTTPSPGDVRAALNKLTFAVQELSGNPQPGSKALTFPINEPGQFKTQLPIPFDRRGTGVFFDTDTGELLLLRFDQLAQRLLVILGAEAVLPYRTREVSESFTVVQEDVNSSIRVNSGTPSIITLPATVGISENFFATLSRFGSGAVEFTAPSGVVIESSVGSTPRIFGSKKPVGIQVIGENRWWVFGDIY